VAEYDRGHKGFLSIKEAAVQYDVSRAKVHRLIRAGQLRARKDPRDRRVTLLLQDELDRLFDIPEDTTRDDMNYETTETTGRLTSETRARVDALRGRMAARGSARVVDSAAIIRAERERRSVELGDAVIGP
jgi:excisionase family DNA binding protein